MVYILFATLLVKLSSKTWETYCNANALLRTTLSYIKIDHLDLFHGIAGEIFRIYSTVLSSDHRILFQISSTIWYTSCACYPKPDLLLLSASSYQRNYSNPAKLRKWQPLRWFQRPACSDSASSYRAARYKGATSDKFIPPFQSFVPAWHYLCKLSTLIRSDLMEPKYRIKFVVQRHEEFLLLFLNTISLLSADMLLSARHWREICWRPCFFFKNFCSVVRN